MNITSFKINPTTKEVSFSVNNNGSKRTSNNNDLSAFKDQLEILQDEMQQFTGNHCTLISFAIKTKTVKHDVFGKIPIKVITTLFEEKRVTANGKEYFQESRFVSEMISETEEFNSWQDNTVKQNVSVSVINSEIIFAEIVEKNPSAFFPTRKLTIEEMEKALFVESEKEQSFAAGFENE